MTPRSRTILFCAAGFVFAALCVWWWFDTMEKRWIGVPNFSDAARENSMLAATRLLKRHGYGVDVQNTLGDALLRPLPDGTIVLGDNDGILTREQAEQLLAWVKKGNTLVTRPKWSNRTRFDACDAQDASGKTTDKPLPRDLAGADPLGSRFGVELVGMMRHQQQKDDEDDSVPPKTSPVKKAPRCLASFVPPGKEYPLELDVEYAALDSKDHATASALADKSGAAARIYDEGKGHVAFVANDYFGNDSLGLNDNAELLLDLSALNRGARHVLLVRRLDVLSWEQALWSNFKYGIISLGACLILLLWIAIRRFGPLLPEPDMERRSLIEHIDASGRWLWRAAGGRASLLDAARNTIRKTLHRRVPDLQRMRPAEQLLRLSQETGLAPDAIDAALNQPASKQPVEFTRQIRTLQQMGKHYER